MVGLQSTIIVDSNKCFRYDKNTMDKKVKNFLLGVGSVIEIAPDIDLRFLAPRKTTAQRMSGHFIRVGDSMRRACGYYEKNNGRITYRSKEAA